MHRLLGPIAALLLMIGFAPAAQAAPPETQRVIVEMRSSGDVAALVQQAGAGGRVRHVYSRVLQGFAAELPVQAVEALRRNPKVASVTPDATVHATSTQKTPPWGLDRIDQRAGRNGTYSYDTTGAGVTVYVVDSGIRFAHTEFGGRAVSGRDFVDDDANASDCSGHGTHVAGTIGGRTYGVAKGVRLVSLRVFDCSGQGVLSDVVAAFDWVVAHRAGPAVINYSGAGPASTAVDTAAARATTAGVTIVAAAGNDAVDACRFSPARQASVITVGASDQKDVAAWFSNVGRCVDLFAPGMGILSSTNASNTSSAVQDGTSMATPHVTGAVARYLQRHPAASVAQVTKAITSSATIDAVNDPWTAHNDLLYVAPPAR